MSGSGGGSERAADASRSLASPAAASVLEGAVPGAGSTTPPSPRFSLSVGHALGTAIVTLHGALDWSGIERLRAALGEVVDADADLSRLVVDLRDACGIHPSSLPVFSAAAVRAGQRGAVFELRGAPAPIAMALRGSRSVPSGHGEGGIGKPATRAAPGDVGPRSSPM